MKTYLKTSYPCLVKTNASQEFVEENDLLEICDEKFVFIYPENNNFTPFFINMNNLNDSEKVSILKKDEDTIIYLEKQKTLNIAYRERLNMNNTTCDIEIYDKQINFLTDSIKFCCTLDHNYKSYKVFKIKNHACVQFDNDIYIYSVSNNKLSRINGENLVVENDKIFFEKKFHDSCNREKTCIYNLEDEIILEEETFMKNNDGKTTPQLISYKFLESIKAKDYEHALSFLSSNLKEKIGQEQLKEFFGNLSQFLPLNQNEFIIISNNEKQFVSFYIKEQIEDISMDKLG